MCVELVKRGYIEKNIDPRHIDSSKLDWFDLTDAGREFLRGSAAPRLKRISAEKTVEALRTRIAQINASPEYMVRVTEAVIFGSYVSGGGTIGDIDVAIKTERKTQEFGDHDDWDRATLKDFQACGRIARTFLDEIDWPDQKVRLHLKNRQRSISLHRMDEFLGLQKRATSPFEVLVGDESQIRSTILHREVSHGANL
jgi:predicted nucleotidyltransferase